MFALAFSSVSTAWQQPDPLPANNCNSHLPFGLPSGKSGTLICRTGYATLNDVKAKLPIWSAYVSDGKSSIGCAIRKNNFAPDNSLRKGDRAELIDYAKSGYDMGHQIPAGDQAYSLETEDQSFLLTNMAPQTPRLNRGTWKLLETYIRAWAVESNNNFLIYVGPVYSDESKTIGPNNVVVPDAFYKIVADLGSKKAYAFIMPQTATGNDLSKYQVTVNEVELLTGIRFAIATQYDLDKKVALPVANLKKVIIQKRIACKQNR